LSGLVIFNASFNLLSGSIPSELGSCVNLQELNLNGNALSGEVPSTITNLVNLYYLSIHYNMLYTTDMDVDTFLTNLQGIWKYLQIIAPTDVTAESVATDSILVSWSPIDYLDDGYYIIHYGTVSGTYTGSVQTTDLTASSVTLSGLDSDEEYFITVESYAPAHVENQNILSGTSGEVSVITAEPTAIPASERAALIAFYNSTNGDSWANKSGWKTAPLHTDGFAMPGTEGTWRGVTVVGYRVTRLVLNNNQLTGSIPAGIGNLTQLTILNLSGNQLTGAVPAEIGNLTQVTNLTFGENQLTGSLPEEIGSLTQLTDLYLANNQFTGSIPSSIGDLTLLTTLNFANNQLTGNIPVSIGNLTQLTTLNLSVNDFDGGIPSEIGNLTQLSELNLEVASLTESIPASIGNLTQLTKLYLGANQLTGSIPTEIGNLTQLTTVSLSDNQLTGSIPVSIGNLSLLTHLYLRVNQLNGEIPAEIGDLTQLKVLDLYTNQFVGEIPAEIGNLTQLTELYLSGNRLTGSIPTEIGNLTQLTMFYLASNYLTGSIPASIGNLTKLTRLFLGSNQLSGELPTTITNLTALSTSMTSISYNMLFTTDSAVDTFMTSKQATWKNTQTIAPSNVAAVQLSDTSIRVSWTPIVYTGNGGYYTVVYGTAPGTYTGSVNTANKSASTIDITGLTADTRYYCAVRTYTPSHGLNINALTSSNSSEVSPSIYQTERAALIALYNSTNGDSWTNNTGWKTAPLHTDGFAMPGTEGTWFGVTVANYRVTKIEFNSSNNMVGTLPAQLGDFSMLEMLSIRTNVGVTGAIPAEIGQLSNLTSLYLESNRLNGTIPPELGNLSKLQYLFFFSNKLSGPIPPELSNATELLMLNLGYNDLSGSIPAELGSLPKLMGLVLYNNDLTGSIPAELGSLTNLATLWLGGNALSGSIPAALGSMTSISTLHLYNNNLTGSIPPELGNATTLQQLVLSNNSLSGAIPSELGNLTNLTLLWLQGNMLAGELPTSIKNLTNLTTSTNIGYNVLYTSDPTIDAFMTSKDADWKSTQTIAPTNFAATYVDARTIKVTWDPIPYSADGGYYRIQIGDEDMGYFSSKDTADKTVGEVTFTNLTPGKTYHFSGDTRTPTHEYNKNSLYSPSTGAVYESTPSATITITAPILNDAWPVGVDHEITYTTTLPDAMNIYLYKDGEYDRTIIEGNTGGSYTWTMPDALPSGSDYTIYCESAVNAAYNAESAVIKIYNAPVLTAPLNAATNLNNEAGIVFQWENTANMTTYELAYTTDSDFVDDLVYVSDIEALTKTITTLAHNTTYYWSVRVTPQGKWATPRSFTTIIAAPAQVTLVSPNDAATGVPVAPTFTWDAESIATTYELDVATDNSFTTDLQQFTGITDTSKSITGLTNSTIYYWRVRAVNAGGNGEWSAVRSFTTIIATPSQVTLVLPADAATGVPVAPTFTWDAESIATTYELDVATDNSFTTDLQQFTGITDTSKSITGLANSTTYYWRVRAVNAGGNGTWSATRSFATIIGVPAQVTLSTPADSATGISVSPTFTWNSASGATTYELQYTSSTDFDTPVGKMTVTNISATSFEASGLSNATLYYWRVRAVNVGGNGEWSAVRSFTTIIATPSQVTLVLPADAATGVPVAPTFTWDAESIATTYELDVATDNSFTTDLQQFTGITDTSKSITGLANSTTYYWRVRAVNVGGNGTWSTVRSFTTIIATPAQVTLVSPNDAATNVSITTSLSWNSVSGASTYELDVATNNTFTTGLQQFTGITDTSRLMSTLANSTTYYWRVRAVNAGGNGDWSATGSFTTIIAAPAQVTLVSPNDAATNVSITTSLSWNSVSGASTYELDVATNNTFTTGLQQFTGITDTSRPMSTLANGTLYYWRVRAVNAGGSGVWSTTGSFTTIAAVPVQVTLISPANAATNIAIAPTFTWNAVGNAESYELDYATDDTFTTGLISLTGITTPTRVVSGLSYDSVYYWRVRAVNAGGSGEWSEVFSFTTTVPDTALYAKVIPNGFIWGRAKVYIKTLSGTAHADDIKLFVDDEICTGLAYTVEQIGENGTLFQSATTFNNYTFTDGYHTVSVRYRGKVVTTLYLTTGQLYQNQNIRYNAITLKVKSGNGKFMIYAPDDDDVDTKRSPVRIKQEPFAVAFENSGKVLLEMVNPHGESGALMRYDNGEWKLVTYSKPVFFIKESGVYVVVNDTGFAIIPKIKNSILAQNYPNPFNPETDIPYTVAESGHVNVSVYDTKGRKVVTLVDDYKERGMYNAHWNGKDFRGKDMPSGVYYSVMEINGKRFTKKMIMLK